MEEYVIPTLESYVIATTSFDLWMSKSRHDTFAILINFINSQWVPCHVIVALFEATNTIGVAMAMQIRDLLASYNLLEKLIACVKDEGGNMSTLTRTLPSIISCIPLAFTIPWHGSCFGHVFSKACRYAYNDTNVCVGFCEVNLKGT